jgi:hypothetical protein
VSAKEKIALYALGIGIFALGTQIYRHVTEGEPIQFENLWMILVLPPLFGYFIWLRWDWAPTEGRKRYLREKEAAARFRREIEAQDRGGRGKHTE